MVIIKLQGGLGNQMFQYATAKSLALHFKTELFIDTSFLDRNTISFDGFTPRSYELYIFNLGDTIIEPQSLQKIIDPSIFFKLLTKFNLRKRLNFFYEKSFEFDPLIFKSTPPVLLSGFFQSEKYFKAIQDKLHSIFSFPTLTDTNCTSYLEEVRENLSVAVHVRRGDFLTSDKTNSFHGLCDLSYYEFAMQEMKRKIGHCKFFFFSDDHDWVIKNLIVDQSTILVNTKNLPAWYDMYLMTQCKHNIIANSSYSWWGAWLNRSSNKVVIAPKKWFANSEMNAKTNDLLPEEWIKL
jgi:hypothetical protein